MKATQKYLESNKETLKMIKRRKQGLMNLVEKLLEFIAVQNWLGRS